MKQIIINLPVFGSFARRIQSTLIPSSKSFPGSENYWKRRYERGKNSGAGSYNNLANFKAEVLNAFVANNEITSIIEYGCGDGNQLSLAKYPKYTGFDVSPKAISMCTKRFAKDKTKSFKHVAEYQDETADLTLSLDVIYHLVEDDVFSDYMTRLFDSSNKFVVIYSSDTDQNTEDTASHVRHRQFSRWISVNKKNWKLIKHIPNKYPYSGNHKNSSFADFYIYAKI